jgi:hypothetical protein
MEAASLAAAALTFLSPSSVEDDLLLRLLQGVPVLLSRPAALRSAQAAEGRLPAHLDALRSSFRAHGFVLPAVSQCRVYPTTPY